MRGLFAIALLMLCGLGSGQSPEVVRFKDLQQLISEKSDKIKVINFWATWCGPCVKELPLFEKLNGGRRDVIVVLVSIDLDLDPDVEKVRSFLLKKKIESKVVLLSEKNPNDWIPQVDPAWTGALPATLIINDASGKRVFIERELHEGELEQEIARLKEI